MKRLFLSLTFLEFLVPAWVDAQQLQVLSSAGQELQGAQFQLSATIGEPCATFFTGDDWSSTVGFQQGSLELALPALPPTATAPAFEATLYPNPVADRLQVTFTATETMTWMVSLFDAQGRLVRSETVTDNQLSWNAAALLPGHFWLLIETPQAPASRLTIPFEKI